MRRFVCQLLHHAGYCGGCLFDFLLNDRRITCTFGFNRGVGDAMPHMFFEQVERDRVGVLWKPPRPE